MATQTRSSFFLALVLFAATLVPSQFALAQKFNVRAKLVGTGFALLPQQGYSVALSRDGNTALVGGYLDNSAWVFTLSGAGWTQQGDKLSVDNSQFGISVALSSDGNTALVGGPNDSLGTGAAWVFTRSGGVWSQQAKLVGISLPGATAQGRGVALSSDGNTALVGGPGDNGNLGAAWVFTRNTAGMWKQQGGKLVGTGAVGAAEQGFAVALSGDASTALVGGPADNGNTGATWVFTRNAAGVWKQQGSRLVGTLGVNPQEQGISVALSSNGNTALVGGYEDDGGNGAAWVFTRSRGGWTQQGSKLAGTGFAGRGVALSADGNTSIVGAPDAGVRIYNRSIRGLWTQQGSTITGTGSFGQSVSLSGVGDTLLIGAPTDSANIGAAWVYIRPLN